MEQIYGKTAKGMVFHYAAANLSVFLQFLTTIVLVKFLPVAEYGVYSLLFSTQGLLGLVSTIVLYAVARFIPDYLGKKNYRLAKKLFWFALKYTLAVGVLFALLLAAWPELFNQALHSTDFLSFYVILFGIINLIQMVSGVGDWTLNAMLEQKRRAAARLAHSGTVLVLSFLLLSSGVEFGGPLGAVLAAVAAGSLFSTFLSFTKINSTLLRLPDTGNQKLETRRVFRYSLYNQLNYIGELFQNLTLDVYLIGLFLGTTSIAWYAFGVRIPQMVVSYSPAVLSTLVVFPSIVQKFSVSKNLNELTYFFRIYTRFTAFFSFPAMLGLVLLAEPFIRFVFSPNYLTSVNVFIVATVAYAFLSFRFTLVNIYNTLERAEIGLYSKIVFLFSTPANIYLLSRGEGIVVIIAVTGAALALMTIIEYVLTARHVPLPLPAKHLLKMAFAATAMALVIYAVRPLVSSLFTLLGVIVIGAMAYFAVSAIVKPFTSHDRELFEKLGEYGSLLKVFAAKG